MIENRNMVANPNLMRGSLNSNYRKFEMNRINKANANILRQLSRVRPAVGNYEDWRRHEKRHNFIKSKIGGHTLTRNFETV